MARRALKKQTIIQGAIILTLAGIFIRILAVGYRIPVGRLLGGEGLGIYAVPNQVYYIFFTISSAGIPVAMARLISEKISHGYYRDAYRTFKVAFAAMFLFGLLFSLLLFFGASWLVESGLVANPASYYGLLAISPMIFFAALTSSFRGLFQGLQNMSPVAASQVGEQVMLVAGTVLFSYLLMPKGLALAAAGANFGAVPGAVAATLIMIFYYFRHRGSLMEMVDRDTSEYREKAFSLLKKILAVSIPVSFASVAMAITGFIDNKLIIDRLQMVGYSLKEATNLYGQINQMAMSFVNISIVFAFALGTSIVPSVAESFGANNKMQIQRKASEAIRLSLITTLPAAAGLMAIAPQLTDLFYAEKAAGIPLMTLAPSIAFWGIHLVLSGVLQGLGRADIPVINLLAGIAVRISITYFLVPTSLGIKAAALGTVAMFLVSSTLNYLAVKRMVGLNVNIPSAVLRPGIASLLMGLAVFQLYWWGMALLGHAYLATIAAILGGAVIYPVLATVMGAVSSDDVKGLPRIGSRAAALLTAYESRRDRLVSRLRGQ
ncbi:MAG: polysaccharide biosynthesis protein [Firmicutes bacterium]|nr:polysaccharide biosynthesis protein [Bacillota bacterium]MCL5056892.1 polysaccharide biosynthesis protein [Actinomycetota bacterium]